MTWPCGAELGEVPLHAHHAANQEPPMHELVPALDGAVSSHGSANAWGHLLGTKSSQIFCLCLQNIGSLSQMAKGDGAIKCNLFDSS